MLNHLWTLLLNQTVTSPIRGRQGELPQSLGYQQVTLPSGISSIRRVLFGADPDIEMLNYRCQQLLTCVLNSVLEPYAFTFDKRNTYDAKSLEFLEPETYIPIPQRINGNSALVMSIFGTPTAPDARGKIKHSFTLTAAGTTIDLTGVNALPVTILNLAANERASLGISGYSFSLSNPTASQLWLIEFLNRPTASLGTLMANVAVVGEPALHELFGITEEEPYTTFRNVFFDSQDLPLKCAAVALALAYQTEKRRTAVS
jgi:hypothetical protein